MYLRKSGGIGVFIKNSLYQHIKLVESSSDYVMWLEVSDANCKKNKPFCLGIVYQPPESSKYYTDDEAELLETEITSICITYNHVYLIGDFNARVSNKNDFMEADTFFGKIF